MTLNRLEYGRVGETTWHQKISYGKVALEALFVDLFLEAHDKPPAEIASCGHDQIETAEDRRTRFVSVPRIRWRWPEYPYAEEFALAHARIPAAAL
ncbi:hypothetical protein AU467_34180 [Mesorhizobium loti]|uniref:Uncharacterized protein n=1 Tax=Rhizobium loti TaxID=381 RepID=A0A101KLX3_RHILI|nr:hypothetical protein AU467_34180 [Mesorhizobium loti]